MDTRKQSARHAEDKKADSSTRTHSRTEAVKSKPDSSSRKPETRTK